jgi:hypothetical protein
VSVVGSPATDLSGVGPEGTPMEIELADSSAVLLFLTGSCYGCRPLWVGAAERYHDGSPHPSVVIVTPSPSTESAQAVAALATGETRVLMSSEAWHAYRVTKAPWCVQVADGMITGDGLAPESWTDIEAMLGRRRG